MGLVFALVCAFVAHAQQPAGVPQHPIDTRPENTQQPGCSYSGTVTDGVATSTKTCPTNGVVPGAVPGTVAPTTPSPAASPAQKFPFSGEEKPASTPQAPMTQNAPAASTAQKFPYPGETTGDAVPAAGQPALNDAGSSSSSSSGTSSSSSPGDAAPSDDADAPKPGPPRPARRDRRKLSKVDPQSPDEREAEDISVADFYQSVGNYKAAYDRAKDAVSLDASDPDAFVAVGDAARRLGKLDEAEKAYQKVLTLDPQPKQKKAAQKALEEMNGTTKSSLLP